MKVAIIKYNAGNIYSVVNALNRLGVDPVLTDDRDEILTADRVLFPGQGEAATTMASLRQTGLDALIPSLRQPVLGICIGMQLMCGSSEEGDTPCLGIFGGLRVIRFHPESAEEKVPHVGWNNISGLSSPLFKDIADDAFIYYVHSYYAPLSEYTIATTTYCGHPYSAALRRDNFYATQFHPEKSGPTGEAIIRNFLDIDG